MTNKIIISVVGLVLSLALSLGSFFYIKKTTEEFSDAISAAVDEARNGKGNEKAVECAKKMEEKLKIVGILVKHSDADELDRLTGLVLSYCENNNDDELIESLEQLRIALKVIYDGEKPIPENIL